MVGFVRPAVIVAMLIATTVMAGWPAAADDPNPLTPLVDASAQRLQTADSVAAYKWINGVAISDPPRVQEVIDAAAADATARGLDVGYVRQVFADQVDASEGVQYSRFAQWKFDAASAPSTEPDLTASREAIDGFNRQIVAEVAAQWNLLRSPGCTSQLQNAVETVNAKRRLDGLQQQALSVAARSYCR